MRKVLVSLMVLSLLPVIAAAAVTNPDGFEDYALTNGWNPTQGGEGWQLDRMYGTGASVASIVSDGAGGKVLDIVTAALPPDPAEHAEYGFEGSPMWDADGGADSAAAVTSSGFDIKPIGPANESEFVAKFARYPDTEPWNHSTWEVGVRGGQWDEFGEPDGPIVGGTAWDNAGTNVYLRTWVSDETYIDTPIPGFGVGVFLIPGIDGAPPETTPEWWRMEIEEDNVTQQTRARMYLRSTTPGDEEGWTPWQDHNPDITYEGTEGQVYGWIGGDMQFDNFYISGEGDPPPVIFPGDANNDGLVSADDYASVQAHFGDDAEINIPGDANLDGLVSADDYASVEANFGNTVGMGGAPVPEPATMLLLGAGSLLLMKRKRKS